MPESRRISPRIVVVLVTMWAAGCASTGHASRGQQIAPQHLGCHAALRVTAPLWTSRTYDSDAEITAAAQEFEAAERLREHSAEVRQAEVEACSALSDADRMTNPLARRDDIAEVVRIVDRERFGRTEDPRTKSVLVRFAPVPGLTRAWLAEALACHLARDRAVLRTAGHAEFFPMSVVAQFAVTDAESGFLVRLETSDEQGARLVLSAIRPRMTRIVR